ncbi:MAG TPA: DUF6734 family protein [Puia sp.]|nr:DUF6734 family protein [Puia sp.]
MRFIKTYWHLPEGADRENYYPKIKREPIYPFALSALSLSRYHEMEIYTNREGNELFAQCKIPCSKITVIELIHPMYRSINDLYVLSLQRQPAVLIDDNLIMKERLDLRTPPETVMTLGIDLNSHRLVKSIIKATRVAGDLPCMNDALWWDKMAYVDTSLLGIGSGTLLEGYIAEVRRFLTLNAHGLAAVPQSQVEDLIKRYWLYSYLVSHDIKFDTYFDDPLTIMPPADEFAFSGRNTVKHIVRLDDYRYSDAQFAMDFFRFFDLHNSETWDLLTEKLQEASTPGGRIDPFSRVRHVLNRKYPEHMPGTAGKIPASATIKRLAATAIKSRQEEGCVAVVETDEPNPDMLEDVFAYEKALERASRSFMKHAVAIRQQQRSAFAGLLQHWDDQPASFARLRLAVNPYAFFQESHWKWGIYWVEGAERDKVAELKVIYNMAEDPAYYITAFVPDVETARAHEFNLDRIAAEIVDHFGEEDTLVSLLEMLAAGGRIAADDSAPNAGHSLYVRRVKDLLRINILYIK